MQKEFGGSPHPSAKKQIINTNKPNAESLSSQHSRKSSLIQKEIQASAAEPGRNINNIDLDVANPLEARNPGVSSSGMEPLQLTKEEERKLEEAQDRGRELEREMPESRNLSPDQLLHRQAREEGVKQAKPESDWKQWTEDRCFQILKLPDDKVTEQLRVNAHLRLAEIKQNEDQLDSAIT